MDQVQKDRGRLVEFEEAFDYNACGKLPQFFQYFKMISNIFDIEFFTNKLGSSANTMSNLEKNVLSGVTFWDDGDDSLFGDSESEEEPEPDRKMKRG